MDQEQPAQKQQNNPLLTQKPKRTVTLGACVACRRRKSKVSSLAFYYDIAVRLTVSSAMDLVQHARAVLRKRPSACTNLGLTRNRRKL